jgi:hypothetical protein
MTEQGLTNLLNTRNNCAEYIGWPVVAYRDRERLLSDIIAMVPLIKWDEEEKTA